MPETCTIRSGEIVLLDDPRLNDSGCTIEPGVIIRPPVDETVVEEAKAETKKPAPVKKATKPATQISSAPVNMVAETAPPKPPDPAPAPAKADQLQATTSVPTDTPQKAEQPTGVTPEAVMLAAGAAVVLAGGAVATSAAGGLSAVQAKIASMLGSKATVAAGAAVAAGTVVAVKAIESKMGKLETDMKKAKEDVAGAASSIDRIDELLSRLGSDNNDKLDPSV